MPRCRLIPGITPLEGAPISQPLCPAWIASRARASTQVGPGAVGGVYPWDPVLHYVCG